MQGRRLGTSVLPVLPALAGLLPENGLRPGAAYSLTPSAALLAALLARSSRDGWCAVVGMPELGMEAAEQAGVDLSRLVLIPDPGARWLPVVATIAEVVPVVAVRPPGRVTDAEAARLSARLRDRGTVLLVQGPWPRAEAALELGDPDWSGLGQGRGVLTARAVTVAAVSPRRPRPARARVLLPAKSGRSEAAPPRPGHSVPLPAEASLPVRAVS